MKITIVSPEAGPLFDAAMRHSFGGAEVRSWLFARGLARRPEVQVQVVVLHDQAGRQITADGIELIARRSLAASGLRRCLLGISRDVRPYAQQVGHFPWVKLLRWNGNLLWQLPLLAVNMVLCRLDRRRDQLQHDQRLGELAGDVLCGFGVNQATEIVVGTAARLGRPSVLFIASDHSLDSRVFHAGSRQVTPWGEVGHLGYQTIMAASLIVVQTEQQRKLLRDGFGRDGVLIRNPIELDAAAPAAPPARQYVLWVGRAEEVQKRPSLCLELARQCPDIPFRMVLDQGVNDQSRRVIAAAPPNVTVLGPQRYEQMDELFVGALALLSTSAFEGFPNTYLQAGKHTTPILALAVDPEGMLTQHGAGVCAAGELELLARTLRQWWSAPELAARHGAAARAYVETHHGLDGRVEELLAVLRQGVSRSQPGAGNPLVGEPMP